MIRKFVNEIKGINFVDIGSSGNIDIKWKQLEPYINLTGFDPNSQECERMSALPNRFKNMRYLPYAIGETGGSQKMYKTKSIYCYSLLKPNTEWLRRFSFAELFTITGEEYVTTVRLIDLSQIQELDVDVIKVDTQGLELPILSNAGNSLDKAFLVETETGFVENYLGETTYSEIDQFMRQNDFLLFDMNTSHRISRNNVFKDVTTGAEQLMWCEATWLKDYVKLIKQNKLDRNTLNREKCLKILILCAHQGCIDFGYELASVFHDLRFIEAYELEALAKKCSWQITKPVVINQPENTLLNLALRLLPSKMRLKIRDQAHLALHQKHLFNYR